MNEHELWVLNRIKESPFPLRCWLNMNGLCCIAPDYPAGNNYTVVGTYNRLVTEKDFLEDLQFSKFHHELSVSA